MRDLGVKATPVLDEPGELRKLVVFMLGSCIREQSIAVYTYTDSKLGTCKVSQVRDRDLY